jgi:hypothetical protein
VAALVRTWKSLTRPQRGIEIKHLWADYSFKTLEKVLPCKDKELRNCVDLAEMAKIGVKLTVGNKKALQLIKEFRRRTKKWEKMSRGAAGRSLYYKLAATIVGWFETSKMGTALWDAFFSDLDFSPSARAEVFGGAPWTEVQFDGDWQAVIQASRPTKNHTIFGTYDSFFGFYREWLVADLYARRRICQTRSERSPASSAETGRTRRCGWPCLCRRLDKALT